MPDIDPIKMLFLGSPGAGKSGALATLLSAGYNVRVLDLDNNLAPLKDLIDPENPKSKYAKDSLSRLSYITLTDGMRPLPTGKLVPKAATVFQKSMLSLDKWNDQQGNSFGSITTWEPNTVFVLDTLTSLSEAAFNFQLSINDKLGHEIGQNEWRRTIGQSQTLIQNFLSMLRDTSVKCHVIVNCHVVFCKPDGTAPTQEEASSSHPPRLVGLPASIGKASAPRLPGYFPTMLYIERQGANQRIYTSTHTDDRLSLKSSAPLRVKDTYDSRTGGLAAYFKDTLKWEPKDVKETA